ncbi:MAG: lipopolysaccharide assembly protein LapA domain-containing protein [Haliea sp.]|nr:lipopolysaccharide assembly protein LapA domain-containing protein [Haliea sp.]MDP4917791.1 lipopolysaccharide assembly protein LapA domain-containing protein [Haliea sp.]
MSAVPAPQRGRHRLAALLRRLVALLVLFAMVAAGVLFALQNHTPVGLDLLVVDLAPRSLALWVLVTLALGGLLGLLASSLIILRLRGSLALARRKLDKSKLELDRLRLAGLKDGE